MSDGDNFDSAGHSWEGRELPATGFERDTGEADSALVAAMDADGTTFMTALAAARLLVPIVATADDVEDTEDGLTVEKSTQMAVVTLTAPDGERALPVFSSIQALNAWNPDARPRPVPSAQAAQAAVAEGCDVLVLDLGSERLRIVRSSMLWALATQRAWLPAYADPFVREAIARAARDESAVVSVDCESDDDGQLRVVLRLTPGLDSSAVQGLCARIGEQIATDGETRARIDALSFRVLTAN
ncbi:SseB family protein [Allobranchiibius sp. CTAmp26]|uniref:SseB family protein n=1 Tax=Allobranchiibius sp. CTAmp26 TaxID=2815214 RepID=UPI001AA1D0EB|nr:SseB family protein [Allobranchiibius sp. CTAmp26]MBO1754482.1 SseB family protein [Allobranchiibius sp. CTAmp26]